MEFQVLNRDIHPVNAPEGIWALAYNVFITKGFKSLQNEKGFNSLLSATFGTKQIIGFLKLDTSFLVFSTDNIDCEIGYVVNDVYTTIINDPALNFKLHNPIEGTFYYNFNKEIIASWCDGINDDSNKPRILNINSLPFSLNVDKSLVDSTDIVLIDVFPNYNVPVVSTVKVEDNGALKVGSYSIFFTYEFYNGDRLPYLRGENFIPIYDEASNLNFDQIDGAVSGTISNKSIKFELSNIDTKYPYLVVSVVFNDNGSLTAYELNKYKIADTTLIVNIDTLSIGTEIDIKELIVPTAIYDKAKTITNISGELHIANLRKKDYYEYQKYANNIKVKMINFEDSVVRQNALIEDVKNSYKDGEVCFFFKSFPSDEVLALYVGLIFNDGERSPLYHIPGRIANNGDTDIIVNNDSEVTDISTDVAKFRVYDTSEESVFPTDEAQLSFWRNSDEFYPAANEVGFENAQVFDKTETIQSNNYGQNVRHHKIPTISSIYKKNLFNRVTGKKLTQELDNSTQGIVASGPTDYLYIQDIVTTLDEGVLAATTETLSLKRYDGTFPTTITVTGSKINVINDGYVNIKFNLNIVETIPVVSTRYINVTIEKYNSVGALLKTEYTNNGTELIFTSYTNTDIVNNIKVKTGDYFLIYVYISDASVLNQFDFTGSVVEFSYSPDVDLQSYPIGLRFKDVYIPSHLRDKVQAVEFFYAQRNVNNSLVIDRGLLLSHDEVGSNTPLTDGRFYGFNLIRKKLQINPTYFKVTHLLETTLDVVNDNYILNGPNLENGVVKMTHQGEVIRRIKKASYFPEDNTATEPSNGTREECFYINVNELNIANTNTFDGKAYYGHLCSYRTNCYLNYNEQVPVSTGKLLIVDKETTDYQANFDTFGGDTFQVMQAITVKWNDGTSHFKTYYFPGESVDNISLRHNVLGTFGYYPKQTGENINTGGQEHYNQAYSALNNLMQYYLWSMRDNQDKFTTRFPFRDAFSEINKDESLIQKWRIFKADAYYEMTRNKGEIWKIDAKNKELYINMEDTLFVASIKDRLNTQITEVYLGVSDIFDRLPDDVLPIPEGYVGCHSQFASIITPIGYLVVDTKQGKIFLITNSLTEISKEGLREYLFNNLNPNGLQSIIGNVLFDNPFTQLGITSAYDIQNERLLISKIDYTPKQLLLDLVEEGSVIFNEDTKFFERIVTVNLGDYINNYFLDATLILGANGVSIYSVIIDGQTYTNSLPSRTVNSLASIQEFFNTLPIAIGASKRSTNNKFTFFAVNAPNVVIDIIYQPFDVFDQLMSPSTITLNNSSFPTHYNFTLTFAIPSTKTIKKFSYLNVSEGGFAYDLFNSNLGILVTDTTALKAALEAIYKINVIVTYDPTGGGLLTITFERINQNLAGDIDNGLIHSIITSDLGEYLAITTDVTEVSGSYTYNEIIPYYDTDYFKDNHFTISYSPVNKGWVAYHNYYPNGFINNRSGLYSAKNGIGAKIYKHNVGERGKFYNDEVFPSSVDFIFSYKDRMSKILESISWISEVKDENSGAIYYNKTATHIVIYSDTQCSNQIAVITNPSDWFKNNARYINGQWNFDDFFDVIINNTLPFINTDGSLITANLNSNKDWFKKNLFIGKFGIVRIIYDNSENLEFNLLDVDVVATKTVN